MELGHLGLVGLHHQRPVVVEEFRDGFGELGLPLLFGFPADEGQLQGVLVIKPAVGTQSPEQKLSLGQRRHRENADEKSSSLRESPQEPRSPHTDASG